MKKQPMIKTNNSNKLITCWAYMILAGVMICAFILLNMPVAVRAEGFDYNTWLSAEKAKYPAGKYWNHAGMSSDNSNSYTSSPCTLHATSGVDHVAGTKGCTCNHFADPKAASPLLLNNTDSTGWHASASQCMGFVNKVGYDMFGSTTWKRVTASSDSNYKTNICVGDIIRINGHSSFVISKSSDYKVTVAECNYVSRTSGKGCLIAWGREINLAYIANFEYYEHATNYDNIISGTITASTDNAQQATTEAAAGSTSFTGWKKTNDGHYQYIKADKLLKKQWVSVKGKKYYVDSNGYRVTGLNKISKKLYYFNNSGVLQKKKWITVDSKTYYIGNSGYALKSQWLYKGKLLVYVKSDCTAAQDEMVKIWGSTYYFNSKFKRSKGFKKYKNQYYYCNSKGVVQKKKWIKKGKKKYYVQKSGVRADDKLIKIGKYKYYFNAKGVMQTNKNIEYKNKIYKADKRGRCVYVKDVPDEEESADSTNSTAL